MGITVLGVLFILVGVFLPMIFNDIEVICGKTSARFLEMSLFVMGGAIIMAGVYENNMKGIPTAMDVYKCKTILRITYKDSIPVDSVVVFKE